MKLKMTAEQQTDIRGFLDKAYANGHIRESVEFTKALTDYAFYMHNLQAQDSPNETDSVTGMRIGLTELFGQFGYALNGDYFIKKVGESGFEKENYKALSSAVKDGIQMFIDEKFAEGGGDASKYALAVLSTLDKVGIPHNPPNKDLISLLNWGAGVMTQFGYRVIGSRLYKMDEDTTDWIGNEVRAVLSKSDVVNILGGIRSIKAAAFVFAVLSMLRDLGAYNYPVTEQIVDMWETAKAYPDDVVALFNNAGYYIDAVANRIKKLHAETTDH